jgi:uncharacterized membrane protein
MVMMKQNRFKSVVVWSSIAMLLLLILNTAGLFDKLGIDQAAAKIIIDSVLGLLVLLGILNNPTDKDNF